MNDEIKKGRKKTKPSDISERYSAVFASRLRELIKEKGITQQELSDGLGGIISRQTINKWTLGTTSPDIISAAAIADYFGVSTDYLLGRTEIKSVDEDIQIACKVTGFSEEAINKIQGELAFDWEEVGNDKHSFDKTKLSRIFECEDFWVMSYYLSELQSDSLEYAYDSSCISFDHIMTASEVLGVDRFFFAAYMGRKMQDYKADKENINMLKLDSLLFNALRKAQNLCYNFDYRNAYCTFDVETWLKILDISEEEYKMLKKKAGD